MNVEENVPSVEDCRSRFDSEFNDRIECFTAKVQQFLLEYEAGKRSSEEGEPLLTLLVSEVQAGLQAAKLECQHVNEDLHFPLLLRQAAILCKVLGA